MVYIALYLRYRPIYRMYIAHTNNPTVLFVCFSPLCMKMPRGKYDCERTETRRKERKEYTVLEWVRFVIFLVSLFSPTQLCPIPRSC